MQYVIKRQYVIIPVSEFNPKATSVGSLGQYSIANTNNRRSMRIEYITQTNF